MKNLPADIEAKLLEDFGEQAKAAMERISEYLNSQQREPVRTARCAIHLAHGSLEKLERMLDEAMRDWRNVILWAEYDKGIEPPQRDFQVPFREGPA